MSTPATLRTTVAIPATSMLEIRLDAMRNFLAAVERHFDLDQTVSLDPAGRRDTTARRRLSS